MGKFVHMGKFVKYRTVADNDWDIWENDRKRYGHEQVVHALLMDIRTELQKLNRVMQCPNVAAGFRALIEMNRRDKAAFNARVKRAVARKARGRK
jgi:hypothetical protein